MCPVKGLVAFYSYTAVLFYDSSKNTAATKDKPPGDAGVVEFYDSFKPP
jgi:hypothetical protein